MVGTHRSPDASNATSPGVSFCGDEMTTFGANVVVFASCALVNSTTVSVL